MYISFTSTKLKCCYNSSFHKYYVIDQLGYVCASNHKNICILIFQSIGLHQQILYTSIIVSMQNMKRFSDIGVSFMWSADVYNVTHDVGVSLMPFAVYL